MYLVTTFTSSLCKLSAESHSIVVNTIEEAIKYIHDLEKDIKIEYGMRASRLDKIYEEGDMNSGDYRKHAIYEEEEYSLYIKPIGVLVSESARF